MSRQTALASALLALIGCGSHQEAEPPPIVPAVVAPAVVAPTPKIPVGAPYLITSDGVEGPARLVEVMLNKKVATEALRKIALEVKSKEKSRHEWTLIFYYLPVEFSEIAGIPWASTHFKPGLEVKILGLSTEEEAAMRKIPLDHKGKRIGAWLQDNQYKTLDLIYEEDGTIRIAEIKSPTERSDSNMIELPSSTGRSFKKVQGSNIYDVDKKGNLRISNAEGQVFSASKPMK